MAILYHGAPVGIIHYDPRRGTPAPRGLPTDWEGPVDLEESAGRVEHALRESYVLPGAEYRGPERAWAVPVAWRNMIILHVHATPAGVLPDAGLQARLRRVWVASVRLSGGRGFPVRWDIAGAVLVVILGVSYALGFHSLYGVDIAPVLTLSGLISGTTLLSVSGVLSETARRLAASAGRGSTLVFTLAIGLLADVTLNDAAILVAAPIAVELAELGGADKVVMLAVAVASVNVGSAIGPYGNPQDILSYTTTTFPWQVSSVSQFQHTSPPLFDLSLLSLRLGGAPVPGLP